MRWKRISVRISDTYFTRNHRIIHASDTHDTYKMQLRIRMSSEKKSEKVSIPGATLTKGPRHLRTVRSRSGLIGSIFASRPSTFVQEMVRVSVCCFAASVVKQTTNPSCNGLNRTLGLSDRNRVTPANVHFDHAEIMVRHATRSSTLGPSIRMPAPRLVSEYHNFCHCSRHRRGSLFGHATHMSSVHCAWQDDQHVQLVVIVAGFGPAKSREQTARDSRRGCLVRCLPVGTSLHVVQFCVSWVSWPSLM